MGGQETLGLVGSPVEGYAGLSANKARKEENSKHSIIKGQDEGYPPGWRGGGAGHSWPKS